MPVSRTLFTRITWAMCHHNADLPAGADIGCREFVELITAYLDGTPSEEVHSRIEDHLETCDGCKNVLAPWRTMKGLSAPWGWSAALAGEAD